MSTCATSPTTPSSRDVRPRPDDRRRREENQGRPARRLKGASVTADILDTDDSDKINVVKFKRRKTYKRNNGHRQHYIKCKVTKIKA